MPYDDVHLTHNTFWEKVATTRWGAYISDIEKRAILKAHELSSKTSTALEIGADGGRWAKLLTDLGWKMICTDTNEQTLAMCKKRIPTAHCILVRPDDNKIPSKSESIGLLLCIEVLPVIQSDWFINESFRILQNDGLVVGVFLNLLSFRGFFAHMGSVFTGQEDKYYKHSYFRFKRKLFGSGYSLLYEEGYCWFPFTRQSNSVLVKYFSPAEKLLWLHKLTHISPWIVFIAQKSSKIHNAL
jgi:hypothetical protein